MKNDKVLQMLGLAARGRKIESGEFSTEKAVKAGKAGLVIVAKDASDNTKKLYRASIVVTDSGFAKALESKILSGEKIE